MRDVATPFRGLRTLAALTAILPASACVTATAGVASFDMRPDAILVDTRSATLTLPAQSTDIEPNRYESVYARDTARVLFKRRDAERSRRFVGATPDDGYTLCLRSGKDTAILVFQRRILDAAISQADDDAVIRRARADTAVCAGVTEWTGV